MKLSSLSLPHPVLGIEDDVNGSYRVDCSVALNPEKVALSIKQALLNDTLEEMIKDGEAIFNVEVQCKQTIFRKSFLSESKEYRIEIPSNVLRNRVDVCFYIVAIKDKIDYRVDGANRDYENNSFEIKKGDVLASGGNTWFPALKDWRALKAADSFLVIEKGNFQEGPVNILLNRNKIVVELSKKDYDLYNFHYRRANLYPIFHSSIVFPVLLFAIMKIKDNSKDYSDCQWYTALNFRKDNEEELSRLDWNEDENLPRIAQIILADPINRMLNASDGLIKLTSETED